MLFLTLTTQVFFHCQKKGNSKRTEKKQMMQMMHMYHRVLWVILLAISVHDILANWGNNESSSRIHLKMKQITIKTVNHFISLSFHDDKKCHN